MNIDNQARIAQAQTSLRNKSATASKNPEELGKKDFMNLFLTQMSHQNPMDPMDSGMMMSQLAQLGSMEQLENLNSQMRELNATQKDISRFESLNYLDKDVLLETNGIELTRGSGNPVYFTLDQDVDNLKVIIEDLDGAPVFSEELGLTTAGKQQFIWDGKDNEGTLMSEGKYNIRITSYNREGDSTPLQPYNSGRVNQIAYMDGKTWVKTKHYTMPLSKVKTVDNSSWRTFGNAAPLPIMHEFPPKNLILDENEDRSLKK